MKPLVLGNLSYGMYAIGVKDGSRPNACIANTVMQISKATPSDAALVAVALSKENYSCQCVEQEGIFSISVLSQDTPATVIGALGFVSGRGVDKLGNIRHKVLIEGVPVIKENTCCWFLCKVQEKLDLPGQVVFVAEIIAGSDEAVGTPMTYKYYVEQLGGASPKYSPPTCPRPAPLTRAAAKVLCARCAAMSTGTPTSALRSSPPTGPAPCARCPRRPLCGKSKCAGSPFQKGALPPSRRAFFVQGQKIM